ncbi:MAG: hypothetical protein M3096_00765 [Actinomycetia bacterium]|nr:hypothetical protein [Actinomycetes bacterium]
MFRRLLLATVAASLVASGCSFLGTLGAEEAVSCSYGGGSPFSKTYMDGPELAPDEFRQTPQGQALDAFFVGGYGEVEAGPYGELDGFSIVSNSFVLGYRDGLPTMDYTLDGDDIQQWGGCNPVLVYGNRVASRWYPVGPIDATATVLPIRVEGGACVEESEPRIITEVVSIEVVETEETVAWTREKGFTGMCAGVWIDIDAEAELASPLGARALLDAGLVRPAPVTETR